MAVELDQDFGGFYEATHRRVISQIYAMCGSLDEAQDCVQEAYARAWQQWSKLSTTHASPEAWVRTVASRLAVSAWRKAVNRLKAHHREHSVTEIVAGMSPDHVAVVAALRKVSVEQRMAIVLFYYAGLSIDEIAAETGAQPGTVRARLARGQKAMAPHLADFAQSLEATPRDARGLDQPHISRKGI